MSSSNPDSMSDSDRRQSLRFSKMSSSLLQRNASLTETSTPATSVGQALKNLDDSNSVPRKVNAGLKVIKITTRGVFKARVVTISWDRFTIFVTPAKVKSSGGGLQKAGKSVMNVTQKIPAGPSFSRKSSEDHVRSIDIADVDCLQMGYVGTVKTENARIKSKGGKRATRLQNDAAQLVSIIYCGKESLDVIFSNEPDAKMFVGAVKEIKNTYLTAASHVGTEELMLRYIWYHIDLNRDGLIDVNEVSKILKRINFYLKSGLQKRYDAFVAKNPGVNGKKGLKFGQCMQFLLELKLERREAESAKGQQGKLVSDRVWDDVFGESVETVDREVFLQKFMRDKQKEEDVTLEDVKDILSVLNSMELTRDSKDTGAVDKARKSLLSASIDRTRFEAYLKSEMNDIYDPDMQELDVEALNKPLTSYWINTSHNTYLTGDQLQSNSSVGMYAAALRRGCKCLELDCWDGNDKDGKPVPIVYHGFTMTSKIRFEDIVTTVEYYVKENPHTYPIILSLENHCSNPFQVVMAEILRTKLRDCLFVYSESEYASRDENAPLPSPEQLKGKVLIKGKRPPEPDDAPDEEDDEDSDDEVDESEPKTDADKKKHHAKIVPELAKLTLFHGNKYKNFTKSIENPPSHMHSISEPKITKILSNDPQNATMWTRYNVNHMTRTYPAGARVDSSNYNPIVAWGVGCQMVALNFQTSDNPLMLNDGRFRQNGGCGYVPKPESLMGLEDKNGKEEVPMTLKLRILLGSCLPKPKGAMTGEVIDPYVKVILHDMSEEDGDEDDEDEKQKKKHKSALQTATNAAGKAASAAASAAKVGGDSDKQSFLSLSTKVHKTKVIDDNGFCPAWLESSFKEFKVHNPDVAMVQFSVRDDDFGDSDDKVAEAAIPVSCLRRGYRCVRLNDLNGSRSGPFGFASLLVEVDY